MTLKTAVSITALLLLAVFGALSLALIRATDLLDLQVRELARAGESIIVAQSLKNRLLSHNRNSFLYQLNHDASRFESSASQRREIEDLLRQAQLLVNNEDEILVFEKVRQLMLAYLERREELDRQPGTFEEKYELASIDVDNASAVVDELVAVNRLQMDQLSASIREQNRSANRAAAILFVFGTFILSGLAFVVFRFMTRPLTELARTITLYSKGGGAVHVVPSGVAEIRTVGENFNSMTERLEEKRQDQLRFIASIAHDLRNPLNSMSIATSLLLRQEPGENQHVLEVILKQANNLDRQVSDLLDTTHIESGHLDLRLSRQNVGVLVQDAVNLHRAESGLHGFNLELRGDLEAQCDPGRLSQVINNLLSNAIKYSPNGGLLSVAVRRDANALRISVSDQGIGIAAEDRENIFKPFHRSRATRGTIPGIGLGLSTSRRIIEAHGGMLTVDSTPDRGSTFHITLP
jgi:signal transduction histidine kinase